MKEPTSTVFVTTLKTAGIERVADVHAKGNPLTFELTGGEAHEVKGYEVLIELDDVDPDRLLGGKGYDSDEIRDDLGKRGMKARDPAAIEPQNADRIRSRGLQAAQPYRTCVNCLKQFRRIATRDEKTARACLSMLCIAAARLWMKTVGLAIWPR